MAENDLLKRLLDAGMTFTALTQARAEELVRDLVRTGAVQAEQAQASVDELVERSRRNRERLVGAVRSEIDDQLTKLDLATRDDLDRMVQRFADVAATLIAQVSPDRGSDTTSRPKSLPTLTSVAEQASAPKSTAKKSAAKKSAAKKSTAKKSAAKKSAAKKSAAKKSTAKKSTAKKSAAKKSTAKKSTAKKSTAKKSTAKKSTAKKTSGQKATGGQSSSDR
jgi:polyhydroxyalkanoate synthesis regulator phasin